MLKVKIGPANRLAILMVTIFCLNIDAVSQGENIIKFRADGCYLSIKGGGRDIDKPIGRDVKITFNEFFKSLRFSYLDEDNKLWETKLSYIQTNEDGSLRMIDPNDVIYNFHNLLEEKRMFVLMMVKPKDGSLAMIKLTSVRVVDDF